MKVPFSWLREFVDVPATADEVAATLSVRGFAVEGLDRAGDDTVIDFEVTGNRPDCMSILGMAREVATAFRVPLAGRLRAAPSLAAPSARSDTCSTWLC